MTTKDQQIINNSICTAEIQRLHNLTPAHTEPLRNYNAYIQYYTDGTAALFGYNAPLASFQGDTLLIYHRIDQSNLTTKARYMSYFVYWLGANGYKSNRTIYYREVI